MTNLVLQSPGSLFVLGTKREYYWYQGASLQGWITLSDNSLQIMPFAAEHINLHIVVLFFIFWHVCLVWTCKLVSICERATKGAFVLLILSFQLESFLRNLVIWWRERRRSRAKLLWNDEQVGAKASFPRLYSSLECVWTASRNKGS